MVTDDNVFDATIKLVTGGSVPVTRQLLRELHRKDQLDRTGSRQRVFGRVGVRRQSCCTWKYINISDRASRDDAFAMGDDVAPRSCR